VWAWVLLFFADELHVLQPFIAPAMSAGCSGVARGASLFAAIQLEHRAAADVDGGFIGFTFWLWLPLVGFAPIMVMTMQALSLIYQFWIHTEIVRSNGIAEAVFNSPIAPSRAPWFQRALSRPQPCRHAHHLGSNVRQL